MHLAGCSVGISYGTSLLALAGAAALGATLGVVGIPPGSEQLLLANGEGKLGCTIHAGKGFV